MFESAYLADAASYMANNLGSCNDVCQMASALPSGRIVGEKIAAKVTEPTVVTTEGGYRYVAA